MIMINNDNNYDNNNDNNDDVNKKIILPDISIGLSLSNANERELNILGVTL
jgi:hypothetical protein